MAATHADTQYRPMSDDTLTSLRDEFDLAPRTKARVTLWLVVCFSHSLIGVFLMGYNTVSLFHTTPHHAMIIVHIA